VEIENIPCEIVQLFNQINRPPLKRQPLPETLGPWTLRPYQINAVDFFARRGGLMVLGDGWSRGKTVTSLAIASTFGFKSMLVVCHFALRSHWKQHILQSCFWNSDPVTIDSLKFLNEICNKNFKGCALVSPSIFIKANLKDKAFDLLVID
jgi:superfamily II DNA or RNA helicase